jgi:adenine deaminase
MELPELLAVARGDEPADLRLAHARVVDVFSGEIEETSVAIAGGRIAGLGDGYRSRETVDLEGRYLAPGLIDAHVHIESALVPPAEIARAVVPRGVTTLITDPHEIANVCGLDGIRFMIADAEASPLEVFVNASSCVPATDLGTSGARLEARDLASLLDEPRLLGLAEVMNFPGVVAGAPEVLAKLDTFAGRVLDGHAPGLGGPALDAYVAAGISSDHESTTLAEAREKLRRGLTLFLREATNARNLEALLPLVTPVTERQMCLCTDDRVPSDLLDEGSVDAMVRSAIAGGVDPVTAIRLATLNTAQHYRLSDRGAVAPGRRADLVVFSDLEAPRAEQVWIGGERVAEDGEPRFERRDLSSTRHLGAVRDTVHLASDDLDFRIPAEGVRDGDPVRVIGVIPDQLVTEHRTEPAKVADGEVVADPSRDLAKIAVFERHRRTGRAGRGLVRGLGLHRGALAGTFAHDCHNLVVAGVDDVSMATAAEAVIEAGGGLAAAEGETVRAVLPLPLAGLMSDRPIEEVREVLDRLRAAARELGSPLHDPFMALSFLTLEVIPALKITDRGLVDVERFETVSLTAG